MALTVADVLKDKKSEIVSIQPDKSILDAIHVLSERRIGSLVVTDGGKMIGLITERDVLVECGRRPDQVKTTQVREVMTKSVYTGVEDDSLKAVQRTMTERRIRHLPITRENRVIGMVSIGDVVKLLLKESTEEADELRTELAGHYIV